MQLENPAKPKICSAPWPAGHGSPLNQWQGCPHGVAPAWLLAAGTSFHFPDPGTSLLPQCRNSQAGLLCQTWTCCQPVNLRSKVPSQAHSPSDWFQPCVNSTDTSHCGLQNGASGLGHKQCVSIRSRTRSPHSPARQHSWKLLPPLHRHASLELLRRPLKWDAVFDGTLGMSSVITYMVITWAHSALSLALHPTTQCSVCTATAHSFYLPVLLP